MFLKGLIVSSLVVYQPITLHFSSWCGLVFLLHYTLHPQVPFVTISVNVSWSSSSLSSICIFSSPASGSPAWSDFSFHSPLRVTISYFQRWHSFPQPPSCPMPHHPRSKVAPGPHPFPPRLKNLLPFHHASLLGRSRSRFLAALQLFRIDMVRPSNS